MMVSHLFNNQNPLKNGHVDDYVPQRRGDPMMMSLFPMPHHFSTLKITSNLGQT